MITQKLKLVTLVLLNLLLGAVNSYGQSTKEEQHTLVSMRMIGHQILLDAGDSVSRVYPIEKENDRYKIQFGTAFAFNPSDLAATIDCLVDDTKIARNYIVEVRTCESNELVYSYEKGDSLNPGIMPCGPRFQPKACYVVFLTILRRYTLNVGSLYHAAPVEASSGTDTEAISTTTATTTTTQNKNEPTTGKEQRSYSMIAVPIGSIFAFIGLFVYFRKKKTAAVSAVNSADSDIVLVGDTPFDQKNMTLLCGNEKIELSSKESDLLSLLYANVNKTIEREYILKVVWGDEGDYIGRTLDVFVSKLRKKLESDPRVKIVNIRGIGYKFIVN